MAFRECALMAWMLGTAWLAGSEEPWFAGVQALKKGELHLRVVLGKSGEGR
jgi:hypothetical protein